MAISKQINIIPDDSWQRIHVSQGDIGRTLQFVLYEGSTSYTIPTGATVKIQGTKPSGLGFSETCTWSGSTVTIDTTEAMTQEFGGIPTELQITDGTDVLGTTNFLLIVERNPHPDNTTDGTQDTIASLEVRIEALESAISSGGITNDIKQALLDCFAHVAWIDANGQTYYDALEDALYPPANLTNITCTYTQSGTVYTTDTLDSLKTDLVVTAHYDNSTTQTVTTYTLSGTLTEGTSTITVSYGGKTTTFNVTVTHQTHSWLYNWDFTQSLTDTIEGNTATTTATFMSGEGLVYSSTGLVTSFDLTELASNSDSLLEKSVEIDMASAGARAGGNNRRIFMLYGSNSGQIGGFIFRTTGVWTFYSGGAWDTAPIVYNDFVQTEYASVNGKTVKVHIGSDGYLTVFIKNLGADDSTYIKVMKSSITLLSGILNGPTHCFLGSSDVNDSVANATISAFRIFEETI